MAIQVKMIGGRTAYNTHPNTWAVVEEDGAVNVFNDTGSWLGWANPEGRVMSLGGFDRRLESTVHRAAQTVRHLGKVGN